MKKVVAFLVLGFVFSSIQAQITFTKGYIVDKAHVRTDCFIRNADWKNNPTEFKYKISENSEVLTGSLETIAEFGVIGESRYVYADAQIDLSSSSLTSLTYSKNPEWQQRKMFLKVLVDGRFKLFRYENNKLVRYFFQINDKAIEQLINKTYYVDHPEKGKVVATNDYFKQQIWNEAKCEKITFEKTKNLHYAQGELEKVAILYNSCFDDFVKPAKKEKEKFFSLYLVPGISISEAYTEATWDDFDFDKQSNMRFGIEGELTLPFNKNKSTIFIEAAYLHYTGFKDNSTPYTSITASIDYSEISTSVGVRYYFFLGEKSKLYINGLVVTPLTAIFNSSITYKNADLNPKPDLGFGAGIGYTYGRFSLETRYYTTRNITNANGGIATTLSNKQAMLKFRFARF